MSPKVLEIITVNNPVHEKILRGKSRKVTDEEIKTPEFQAFLDDLYATLKDSAKQVGWDAAGIAAVQVNNSICVFYAMDSLHDDDSYTLYINPEIELLGSATDTMPEGCLSVPAVEANVERHKRVRITYTDREGQKQTKKLSGFRARIVQHEYDHLPGILFTDKLV